jgi:hypothetical protein
MFFNGSVQNEHSSERTSNRCFLTSFTSFGWGVSEEKIKMWKVNGRQTPSDGKSSRCLWQGELIKKSCLLGLYVNLIFWSTQQTAWSGYTYCKSHSINQKQIDMCFQCIFHCAMAFFFRFVDKRAIYRWYNLIRTCAGECDWLFHWQHKLCAIFSANININYRLPIKVYYRICTFRHIRIEINHGNQNVFWVLTWVGGY